MSFARTFQAENHLLSAPMNEKKQTLYVFMTPDNWDLRANAQVTRHPLWFLSQAGIYAQLIKQRTENT